MNVRLSPLSYGPLIDLGVTFEHRGQSGRDRGAVAAEVVAWLKADTGTVVNETAIDHAASGRTIRRLLTVRPPRPIPADVQSLLDEWFAIDAASRPRVSLAGVARSARARLARGETTLYLWRGDITALAVDAIVNAANSALLGCFRPGHACIDNAVHSVAGPRLREDCRRVIEYQGHPEPTGTVKVTRGYYLPSRFVLHTVGPIVRDAHPTKEQRTQLARCYESCLDVAADLGLRSVAFCAISTGVFGYPKTEAAGVAMDAVRGWVDRQPAAIDDVVFDVFSEADEAAYMGPERFA